MRRNYIRNMVPKRPIKTKPFSKLKILFIAMASVVSITLLSLLIFFTHSTATRHHRHNHNPSSPNSSFASPTTPSSVIIQVCKASRDPPTCESSLTSSSHVPSNPTVVQLIQSAIGVSSDNLKTGQSMVKAILDASTEDLNRTNAAKSGLEMLGYADYRMKLTADALPRGKIKDGRAWMSAALAYQYDCWSALKYVNGTSQVSDTMAFLNNTLIASSSNALSMMWNYDNFGDKTESWSVPKTERVGFWEGLSGSSTFSNGCVPSGLKPDVTVCPDGKCDFLTVQEAVNTAPSNAVEKRFVIAIRAGVYKETVRVPLEKKNVVFLGDGMGVTVITGSANVGQPGMSTFNSATVGVIGDGFMAANLTIQNTAGPDTHQAVAFRSDSDHSIIENCEFLGNQDTLYAKSLRQYYKSCRIQGNVDFIFGNSASFFQDCTILIAPRQLRPEKGENNAVTAHGRIDPGQTTGFVFQNCLINGTDKYMELYYSKPKVHKNFLGRPWKEYSRTVFINCTMEVLITPDGWMPWSGDFALATLYYGEFQSTGLGGNSSGRVSWSSQVPNDHVNSYSVESFIQGGEWMPLKNRM